MAVTGGGPVTRLPSGHDLITIILVHKFCLKKEEWSIVIELREKEVRKASGWWRGGGIGEKEGKLGRGKGGEKG